MSARILAVVVLYRMRADESASLRGLVEAAAHIDGLAAALQVLVYDNSTEAQPAPTLPFHSEYISDPTNQGLATAYGAALERAARHNIPWLLLLDQDTSITTQYMRELLTVTEDGALPQTVAAAVPRLVEGTTIHSPKLAPRLRHGDVIASNGLLEGEITAYNSGTLLRVASLERAGGLPLNFSFHFLDHALFKQMQLAGGRVWLLRSGLQHALSAHRLGEEMSLASFSTLLDAEARYYREYGSATDRMYYRLRRFKQALGYFVRVRDKRFSLHSALAAFRPLSRKR